MTDYQILLFSGQNNKWFGRPMAIYRLASHLREHNITVKTIDFFSQMSDEVFYQAVDRYVSDATILIGLSATVLVDYKGGNFFGIRDSRLQERINYIKQKNPNVKFVIGGGQCNNMSLDFRKKIGQYFDYLSIGQGENTLLAIAEHLLHGKKLITTTIDKPLVVTDKTYPFTTFNSSKNIFTDSDHIISSEALPIEIARGCIFKCKFCSYDLTNKKIFDYTKTEEHIREELIYNYENYQTQYYYVVDDLINDSTEKIDMLERIIKSLPFKIYFSGYCRLDLLWRYPQMIQQLKDIGLLNVFFGIETINDKSGRAVGKGLGKKKIEETLKRCADIWQNDVHIEGHFIIGLPHDTKETVDELAIWSNLMLKNQLLHTAKFEPLSINPTLGKADIDQHPEKFGYNISNLTPLFDESTRRTRFINHEANWTTENYSWIEACEAAAKLTEESDKTSTLQGLSSFNTGMVAFLSRKFMPVEDLIRISTKKKLITEKQHSNLIYLIDMEYEKYMRNYFNQLLNNQK